MGHLEHVLSLRFCAAAALVAVCACGCQSPSLTAFTGTASVTALRPTQSGRLVTVKLGRTLTAGLPPDEPGRRWRLSRRPDAGILRPLGVERSGAGPHAKLDFVFKAVGVGTTSFAITRPPRDPHEGPEVFELTVYVRSRA